MGKTEPNLVPNLFIAESFLTGFFALQISFARSLEPDTQDEVYSLMRTYPLSPSAWFTSKYCLVVMTGTLVMFPTILVAAFFHLEARVPLLHPEIFLIAFLALIGLAAIGVLLSTMMLGANTRQILYPIIYFPLTCPVLISAVEASRAIIDGTQDLSTLFSSWLGLLLIFDIIYCTIGFLLFGELTKAD